METTENSYRLDPHTLLSLLSVQPRTTCPSVAWPLVGWDLPHQPLAKKVSPRDLSTGQSDGDTVSIEVPLSWWPLFTKLTTNQPIKQQPNHHRNLVKKQLLHLASPLNINSPRNNDNIQCSSIEICHCINSSNVLKVSKSPLPLPYVSEVE